MLIGCIRHIAKSPLRLSHSAVALTLHLILPSWLETSIKVSELFFRANSTDGRWGELGRIILRREGLATIDAATSLPQRNGPSRTGRAAYLARTRLQWHMFLRRRSEGRRDHIFDTPPHIGVPPHGSTEASSNAIVSLTEAPVVIVHDLWHGWDTDAAATRLRDPIDVYTDGTFDSASAKSAWSVVLGDRWLDNNFSTIPADERLVLPSHVAGATLYGAHIACTLGIYPAELQAIARALAMFSLHAHLHIHSDSQASLKAISTFNAETKERARCRMSARPLLELIRHLVQRRQGRGGSVEFSHVRAHSDETDKHSVGNRLADYQATIARRRPERTSPFGLRQLPVDHLEQHMHAVDKTNPRHDCVIIDDPRSSAARDRMRLKAFDGWRSKPVDDPQRRFV